MNIKVHNIKILFCNFQNDYIFSNLKDLQNIIKEIKEINMSSIYLPIITIVGFNYWLNFNLNTDLDYLKMENNLIQIYHIN